MWYKHQKSKKLALNSSLQTYQILTNDDEMLILRLSYFSTTVASSSFLGVDIRRSDNHETQYLRTFG